MSRVTRLRVRDWRTARDVDLELGPATVLFGAPGVGKSTLVQALEVAREVVDSGTSAAGGAGFDFQDDDRPTIGVEVELGDGSIATYEVTLAVRSTLGTVVAECDRLTCSGEDLVARDGDSVALGGRPSDVRPSPVFSSVRYARYYHPAVREVASALSSIRTRTRVGLDGAHLSRMLVDLRCRADWGSTLETIQLAVDHDVVDVRGPGGLSWDARLASVVYRGGWEVPVHRLSDGTRALLSLVALTRVPDQHCPATSILAVDDVELHLGPAGGRRRRGAPGGVRPARHPGPGDHEVGAVPGRPRRPSIGRVVHAGQPRSARAAPSDAPPGRRLGRRPGF